MFCEISNKNIGWKCPKKYICTHLNEWNHVILFDWEFSNLMHINLNPFVAKSFISYKKFTNNFTFKIILYILTYIAHTYIVKQQKRLSFEKEDSTENLIQSFIMIQEFLFHLFNKFLKLHAIARKDVLQFQTLDSNYKSKIIFNNVIYDLPICCSNKQAV